MNCSRNDNKCRGLRCSRKRNGGTISILNDDSHQSPHIEKMPAGMSIKVIGIRPGSGRLRARSVELPDRHGPSFPMTRNIELMYRPTCLRYVRHRPLKSDRVATPVAQHHITHEPAGNPLFVFREISQSSAMASFLLLRRPLFAPLSLGLGISAAFATHSVYTQIRRPLLCESASPVASDAFRTYTRDAKVPVVKNGRANPAAYKQISSGSILGEWG